MGMPDYEWGPIFEKTLTAYSDLIPLNDCQKSFDLLELRHFNTIISMPFCYGNNIVSYSTEMNQNNTYYRNYFVPLYNSFDSYEDTIKFFRQKGLRPLYDKIIVY